MKILIVGDCLDMYLAKCHEAFRTGLRRMVDARPFGKGYPFFNPVIDSYRDIIDFVFPDGDPDLIITHYLPTPPDFKLPFSGLDSITIPKAIYFGDYWGVTNGHIDVFNSFIVKNGIHFILSYFPQPLKIFPEKLASKTIWVPPCFDPEIFNDWNVTKEFDVGFLAAGTTEYTSFYPERYLIHNTLKQQSEFSYLWAEHPGWQMHALEHPLVGSGYSKKINACRSFITTSGIYHNLHAKYFEILASKTLLFADFAEGASEMHFQDGENFIRITPQIAVEKIAYYLKRPDEMERIAEAGHIMIMRYHNCFARAIDFREKLYAMLPKKNSQHLNIKTMDPVSQNTLRISYTANLVEGILHKTFPVSEKNNLRHYLNHISNFFPSNSLSEISLIDVIDVLPIWDARILFKSLFSILKSGGKLFIEGADLQRMAMKIMDNIEIDFDQYLEGIRSIHGFGLDNIESKNEYIAAPFSWSAWHLSLELERVGFREIDVGHKPVAGNWRDFSLQCHKPE